MITYALSERYGQPHLVIGPFSLWVHGRRDPSDWSDGNTLLVSCCWVAPGQCLWLERQYEVRTDDLEAWLDEIRLVLSGVASTATLESASLTLTLSDRDNPRLHLVLEGVGVVPGQFHAHSVSASLNADGLTAFLESASDIVQEYPFLGKPPSAAPNGGISRHFTYRVEQLGWCLVDD